MGKEFYQFFLIYQTKINLLERTKWQEMFQIESKKLNVETKFQSFQKKNPKSKVQWYNNKLTFK